MKKIHKVQITCNWCNDSELYLRFQKCYTNNFDNIQYVCDGDYDYLVVFNDDCYHKYDIKIPRNKIIGVVGEPYWSGYRFIPKLKTICNHIFYHLNMDDNQIIFYPGLLPNHFDLECTEQEDNIVNYLSNNHTKTEKCSIVVSNFAGILNDKTIYHSRVKFVHDILKTDLDVHIYGKGWDEYIGSDSRIKGEIKNKKGGIDKYKFSIAIENSVEENYFTEKLTDCILLDTTPIYFGCPNINNYFDNIYNLHSLDVEELEDILSKPQLMQDNNKLKIKNKYNLFTAIGKYINHNENI